MILRFIPGPLARYPVREEGPFAKITQLNGNISAYNSSEELIFSATYTTDTWTVDDDEFVSLDTVQE